jgi:hypothetical protein
LIGFSVHFVTWPGLSLGETMREFKTWPLTMDDKVLIVIEKDAYDMAIKALKTYAEKTHYEAKHWIYEYEWLALRVLKELGEIK